MNKKRSGSAPLQPVDPRPIPLSNTWKRTAISAFILFHLVVIASWCLPINSLLNDRWKQTIGPYVRWSGLFQAWDMFAPDPAKLNSYVSAEITFHDGSTRAWAVPANE